MKMQNHSLYKEPKRAASLCYKLTKKIIPCYAALFSGLLFFLIVVAVNNNSHVRLNRSLKSVVKWFI